MVLSSFLMSIFEWNLNEIWARIEYFNDGFYNGFVMVL